MALRIKVQCNVPFPELLRRSAARDEHWLVLLRARAIENQCCVAAANRCGQEPLGQAYSGRSQIIDPRGVVLADAGDGAGIIQALVDIPEQRQYRRKFSALADVHIVEST